MSGIRLQKFGKRHAGFSSIEFVTTIGVIFLLIVMLLPAILRVRETARASQCLNNLKQLSLALHNYHDAHQTFPPGYISIMGVAGDEYDNEWGWGAFLLPYLDQFPLFRVIDFSTSVTDNYTNERPYVNARAGILSNSGVAQTSLPPFSCPMDEMTNARKVKRMAAANFASSSYSGVTGIHWQELPCATLSKSAETESRTLTAEPCVPTEGVFSLNSHVQLKQIRDGTSQTMFLAETSNRYDYPTQNSAPARSGSSLLWGGTYWASVVTPLAQDRVLTATIAEINTPDETGFSAGMNSRHPGGVFAAYVDGSVHFLSEKIDSNSAAPFGVLQKISTIQAGDIAFEF